MALLYPRANRMTRLSKASFLSKACDQAPVSPPHRRQRHGTEGTVRVRARGSAYGSEGGVQRPVTKTVLQEDIQLLLDKPRHSSPVGTEGQERSLAQGVCPLTGASPGLWVHSGNTENTEVRCF